jgi:hypothetical protein
MLCCVGRIGVFTDCVAGGGVFAAIGAFGGADWENRYFELSRHRNISKYFQEDFFKDFSEPLAAIDNVFARNNRVAAISGTV